MIWAAQQSKVQTSRVSGWILKQKYESTLSRLTRCSFILFAAATLLLCVPSASAQQITGGVLGVVQDAQGALVPNAKVKATNSSTGLSRTAMTDGTGAYTISYLPVGNYSVTVEASGFKRYEQQNVTIAVDQVQSLPVSLSNGEVTDTVTVTTAPPLVNTTSESVGRTISPEEINNLPLVNRNAYTEISLTAGVQSNSTSTATNPNGTANFAIGVPSTQVIINGGVDGGVPMVSFYLDGGINMTGIRNYGNPLPNPDALQEFRVETSNFAAQYGKMSGGVVTAVTRSGTNAFHGTVFEFLRNTHLNATPWGSIFNAPYHRNNFGATVGGPVKRDKAFFFASYAGLRQAVGQQLTGGILLSPAERLGDFTEVATPIFQPNTNKTIAISGTNSSPNCATAKPNCIPTAMLDPTAQNFINKLIPLPNLSGNRYTGFFTSPTSQDEYLGKFDTTLGAKDHLSISYFNLKTTQNAFGGGNIPYSVNESFARQQNLNVSDIHSFSGSTVNQVWLTLTRVAGGRINLPQTTVGDLGSSYTIQGPPALPSLSVSGFFSASTANAGPVSDTDFYSVRDVFSMTKGSHALTVGGEGSLEKDALQGTLNSYGIFNFQTSGPSTTGNALADFVTGAVASMEQDTPYHSLTSYFYGAGFVQDQWRLTPRLTANLGIRYDVPEAPVESQNLTASFVPGQQSSVIPSAPTGVLFPGDRGIPRGIASTQYGHVSPRVGLIFDPFGDGKTAVRAGAGIFYGSVSGNEWNQPANAQPFAVRQTFNSIASFTNVYGNPASFPTGDPFPYVYNPQAPRFLPNASVEAIDPKYKWPVSYEFNVSVEQQLPLGFSFQTSYVGNLVRHVPTGIDANNPVYAPGASASQASLNARRPFDQGILGQVIFTQSTQTANYNSLQVAVHKPLTHHLLLNGFYVWSHSLWSANSSAIGLSTAQNFSFMKEERGPSDNDRRSVASVSGVLNFDYYSGRNRLAKNALNGWKVSFVGSFQSGNPFNITTGGDANLDGYTNDRPNLTGANPVLNPHRDRFTAANLWFNKAAFTVNGPGLPGGIGPGGADGNTPRDYLTAPGFRDVDLGLVRDFSLVHGTGLELRADATNAFNMVSLNAPTANLSSGNNAKITSAASPRLIQVGAKLTF
jgi:hypothetical protein